MLRIKAALHYSTTPVTCSRGLPCFQFAIPSPARNSPFAWLIIGINSLVFVFELMMPEPVLQAFFYYFGIGLPISTEIPARSFNR